MRASAVWWCAVLCCGSGEAVLAQSCGAPVSRERIRSSAIVSRGEVFTAGVFTLGAIAAMPFDGRIARYSQRATLQRSEILSGTATVFRDFGDPGTVMLSLGAYGVGALSHNRTVADIGLHSGGAIVVSAIVTSVLKGATGRARPYVVADSDSHSYAFGRGFREGGAYQSLPSGHTTAAFALAAVMATEARQRWPKQSRLIAPFMFGVAALAGASRIYNNKHWASDVVLGAGIGTVSGLAVARHQHACPGNWIDGHLLPGARSASLMPMIRRDRGGSLGAGVAVHF